MYHKTFSAMVIVCALTGCQTAPRGMHYVPVPRDYGKLARQDAEESAAVVAYARRLGTARTQPYAFYSAEGYLKTAYEKRAQGDLKGMWDYAGLAKRMAETAIGYAPDPAEIPPPASGDIEAAWAKLEAITARYEALDGDKAAEVAPVLYAELTVALSRAEHTVSAKRHWRAAWPDLDAAEADLDTLLRADTDGDGIPDMEDRDPMRAEDFDGFEDSDGAPDLDNDGDGVPDDRDAAPLEPETVNRWRDYDGAPDTYPALAAVHFARASAALSPDAQGYLRGVALLSSSLPDLKLRIRGHCTDFRSDLQDLDLSRRRAEAVQRYLIQAGVPEERLTVTFRGANEPIEDIVPAKANAENQRVELVVE